MTCVNPNSLYSDVCPEPEDFVSQPFHVVYIRTSGSDHMSCDQPSVDFLSVPDGSSWENSITLQQYANSLTSKNVPDLTELWLERGIHVVDAFTLFTGIAGGRFRIFGGFTCGDLNRDDRMPVASLTTIRRTASSGVTLIDLATSTNGSCYIDSITFNATVGGQSRLIQLNNAYTLILNRVNIDNWDISTAGRPVISRLGTNTGKVDLRWCDSTVSNCAISGQSIVNFGNASSPNTTIQNVKFMQNTTTVGIILLQSTNNTAGNTIPMKIVQCTFVNNNNTSAGGSSVMTFRKGSIVNVVNSIIVDNSTTNTTSTSAAIVLENTGPAVIAEPVVTMSNCIMHKNNSRNVTSVSGTSASMLILNSCLFSPNGVSSINTALNPALTITQNPTLKSADPLFVDDVGPVYDLHLQVLSPAINMGQNQYLTATAGNLGVGTPYISNVTCDLDGNDRVVDDFVDMGVYENQCRLFCARGHIIIDNGTSVVWDSPDSPSIAPFHCLPDNNCMFVDGGSCLSTDLLIGQLYFTIVNPYIGNTTIAAAFSYDCDGSPSIACVEGTDVSNNSSPSLPPGSSWQVPIDNSLTMSDINGRYCFEVLLCWDGSPIPCVHGDTKVLTMSQNQTPVEIPIRDLRKGDLVFTSTKEWMPIIYNIRIQTKGTEFIEFAKSSLGENIPSCTMLIRTGHPILLGDGTETECQLLVNEEKGITRKQMSHVNEVFTLALEPREGAFVHMQGGVMVKAWDAIGFDFYLKNSNEGRQLFCQKL